MEAREAASPSLSEHFAAFNSANFRSGVMEAAKAARGRRRRHALDRDAISEGIVGWRCDLPRPPTSWDGMGVWEGNPWT